jgi:predicted ATP-grasp superfamily ATP-dependent carboligase
MIRMRGPDRVRTVFLFEFVTGGGLAGSDLPPSWAAEGHAMRRALAEDFAAVAGVEVVQTLDRRFEPEPGQGRTIVVGPNDEERTFLRLAAEADHTLVVAPETELFLLDRTEAVERLGTGRLISCGSLAVRLAGNKYETARLLAQHGLPTPPTFWRGQADRLVDDLRLHFHRPGAPVGDTLPLPAVLKSNDGAGSIDTFLVADFDSIPQGADGDILQPFVAGEPWSASFLIGADGRAHLVGQGRQRMEIVGGRFTYLGGEVPAGPAECDPALRRAVEALPGARGWVGVDFLRDPQTGAATILEINPRLTTSFVGLRRLVPPGAIAAAWLEALDDPAGARASALAGLAHAAPPVRFQADGSVTLVEKAPVS